MLARFVDALVAHEIGEVAGFSLWRVYRCFHFRVIPQPPDRRALYSLFTSSHEVVEDRGSHGKFMEILVFVEREIDLHGDLAMFPSP